MTWSIIKYYYNNLPSLTDIHLVNYSLTYLGIKFLNIFSFDNEFSDIYEYLVLLKVP